MDLSAVGGDRFEGTYDGFTVEGLYNIVIYALDNNTETSLPQLTSLSVSNPFRRKAIIAVGADPASSEWPAIEAAADIAYQTLVFQQYADDPGGGNEDIKFYAPTTFNAGVDGTLTQSNLSFAINTWAADEGQSLVVYLLGPGDTNTFRLNDSETLNASTLDGWLDTLQASIPGVVTVLYDGDKAATFADNLIPPVDKKRIFIGSTNTTERASFIADGVMSYSRFFWPQIANGATVGQAHALAVRAMDTSLKLQSPTLDDNGNGTVNEKLDGVFARRHNIGTGIILAGDFPLIGGNTGNETIAAATFEDFGVTDVTTTGTLSRVWALITPPGYTPAVPHLASTVDLSNTSGTDYAGDFDGFTEQGDYQVAIFAEDDEGVVSVPSVLTINQPSASFTEAPTANELRDNFDALDTDESQGLTLAEARVQIPGLTASLFNQLDDDSNGELTQAELLAASIGPPGALDPVYVDFSYNATECGTDARPFNTLGEGAAFVQAGGTLYLSGGNSPESVTIATPMTLAVQSTAVTIGAP